MQLRYIIAGVTALAVATGITIRSYAADEPVSLSQVPTAVQVTIKAQVADGKVGKIVKGVEDGKTVYEAIITKGSTEAEITIDPDGKLLGSEEKMSLKDVPAAVRETIQAQAGTSQIKTIEKAIEGEKVAYEAILVKDGKDVEIVVAPDGKLQTNAGAKAKGKEGKEEKD